MAENNTKQSQERRNHYLENQKEREKEDRARLQHNNRGWQSPNMHTHIGEMINNRWNLSAQ